MKHIKEYNTYVEISWVKAREITKTLSNPWILNKDSCILTIKKHCPTLDVIGVFTGLGGISVSSNTIQTQVYELPDEYFLIRKFPTSRDPAQNIYYKCDQIEGVIDCLKQIYSI